MELTINQKKGIKIIGKVLSKKYPFVIGLSPNTEDLLTYSTILTFNLIISKSKLEDHFNQKVKLEDHFNQKVKYDCRIFWRFSNLFNGDVDPEETFLNEIKNLFRMFYICMSDEYHFKSELRDIKFRQIKLSGFVLDDKN